VKKAFCITLFAVIAISAAFAAPEPAIVPKSSDWNLQVQFEHPRQIMVRTGRDAQLSRYWYIFLTITNNAGREVNFYSKCELMTDSFQIIPAGKDVSPAVFEKIKKLHHRRYPFLQWLRESEPKILQGQDNTRDIAVIWPDFDAKAHQISLFVSGLSNETAVIEHPIAKRPDGRPLKVYLRKTLQLNYTVRSDVAFRSDADLHFKGKHWVMR